MQTLNNAINIFDLYEYSGNEVIFDYVFGDMCPADLRIYTKDEFVAKLREYRDAIISDIVEYQSKNMDCDLIYCASSLDHVAQMLEKFKHTECDYIFVPIIA